MSEFVSIYIIMMRQPINYSNLFLDMNAFFASVEQQVQPSYRSRPICVAPYTGNTGCCIAKSYEAKDCGVQTGVSVGEAKKLCPQILILESRPELYMFYHREIIKVLEKKGKIAENFNTWMEDLKRKTKIWRFI